MLVMLFVRPSGHSLPLALLFGFILALCFAPVAQAASSVALVIASRGEVVAVNSQGQRVLQRRSALFEGDRIETGNNSQVQIRFIDGALLTLEHQTKLEISRFENSTANKSGQVLLRLIHGGLRNLTGAIAEQHPDRYRVESAIASIGVRGTDFRVVLRNDKLAAGVYRGGIIVSNNAGQLELGSDREFSFAWVTSPRLPPKGHLIAPSLLDDDSPQLRLIPSREDVAQAIVQFNHENTLNTLEQQVSHRQDERVNNPTPVDPTPVDPTPVDPTPVDPTPVDPTPVDPTPVDPTPVDPTPVDPTPINPLPEWVNRAPLERHSLISVSGLTAQGEATQGNVAATLSNNKANTPDGLLFEFSNSGSISMVDQAYVLNGSTVEMTQVDSLPIYWGSWNGSPELLLYQSRATEPVTPLSPAEHALSWIYVDTEIFNLDSLSNTGISRLNFSTRLDVNNQWPLTSIGSDGALAENEHNFQLGINLNTQTVDVSFDLYNRDFSAAWTRDVSAPSLAFTNNAGVIEFAGDAQLQQFGSSNSSPTITTQDGRFSFNGVLVNDPNSSLDQQLLLPAVMQLETNDQSHWSQVLMILEGTVPNTSNNSGLVQ